MTDENKEIQIIVDLIVSDYKRALWQHSRRTLLIAMPVLAAFVFLAVWLTASALLYGNVSPALTWYLALGLPPFAISCLTIVILYVSYGKQARQLASLNERTKITFTATELISDSRSSAGRILLTKFAKAVETPIDFIFYQQDKVFFPIPKRFFEDGADIPRLRKILTSNLGDRAKLLSSG